MTDYVDIDGLRFYGDLEGAQSGWVYESLQGWYSSPPMRGALADRPTGDGAFGLTKAYRSARPLKFTGTLFADNTVSAIRELWARFSAIQSSGALFPITVTDDFGSLTCLVTLNGQATVNEAFGDDGQSMARVEATFLAPDPIKYGSLRTVTTGVPTSGGGLEYPLHSGGGTSSFINYEINSGFELSAAGMAVQTSGGGAYTFAQQAGGDQGSFAGRITVVTTASTSPSVFFVNPLLTDLVAGDDFYYAVRVKPSIALTIRARRRLFSDAAGTVPAATALLDGSDVAVSAGVWTTVGVASTMTTGVLSSQAAIRVAENLPIGTTIDVDVVMIKKGLTVIAPFDGGSTPSGTSSYGWIGTAYAGQSIQYLSAAVGPNGSLYYGANGYLGRVILANAGTASIWPTLRVTGPFPAGFFVQRLDTGQVVRYDRVVPSGSTVTINFRTGEVLIDGISDGSTYLTRYEFFSIAPGGSVEVQLTPIAGGTGTADFYVSDGFW